MRVKMSNQIAKMPAALKTMAVTNVAVNAEQEACCLESMLGNIDYRKIGRWVWETTLQAFIDYAQVVVQSGSS